MANIDIGEVFERCNDEFLKFEHVKNKLHRRPDMHAFLLLDQLVPGDSDMVAGASHDEIWLEVDCEALAAVVTEEQLIDLHRCGIRYDETDSLCMFV